VEKCVVDDIKYAFDKLALSQTALLW